MQAPTEKAGSTGSFLQNEEKPAATFMEVITMKNIKKLWTVIADDLAEAIFELRSSTHDVFTF